MPEQLFDGPDVPLPSWVKELQRLMEEEAKQFSGHPVDEDGWHDKEACFECLLKQEVKGACRCAECCKRLIIDVGLEDANREPKIAEKGSPILSYPDENGVRHLEGYLLNGREDIACIFLDKGTNLCTIYETRPLSCRLFDCAGEGREQLIELGILPRDVTDGQEGPAE